MHAVIKYQLAECPKSTGAIYSLFLFIIGNNLCMFNSFKCSKMGKGKFLIQESWKSYVDSTFFCAITVWENRDLNSNSVLSQKPSETCFSNFY